MTILEALKQLRDDLKLWCTNNLNNKLNKNLGAENKNQFLVTNQYGEIIASNVDVTDTYETKIDAQDKLNEAKQYTDIIVGEKVDKGHKHLISDIVDYTEIVVPTKVSEFENDVGYISARDNNILDFLFTDGTIGLKYDIGKTEASCLGIGEAIDTDIEVASVVRGIPVTKIAATAFRNCTKLTSVVIPDSVTSIGNHAFYNCTNLTSITIPDSVNAMGNSAFYNCKSLTSVTIPDSVTEINPYVFQNCSNLINITIPDGATTIGDYAFSNCTSLTSVVIPDNVTNIGDGAFYWCDALTNVYYKGTETGWGGIIISSSNTPLTNATVYYYSETEPSNNGLYWHYVNGVPAAWVKGSEGLEYTLNSDSTSYSVTGIGTCEDTDVIIPKAYNKLPVTNIGNEAFRDCSSLTSISIPDSVTSIGAGAFMYCSSLTSVVIPDSVTSIDRFAFRHCSNLISVVVGNSVTEIGSRAFDYCSRLADVYYKGTETEWSSITIGTSNTPLTNATIYFYSETEPSSDGNYWYYVNGIPTEWETKSEGLEYTLNSDSTSYSVTGIGTCEDTDVIIPNRYNGLLVTKIYNSAFNGCSSLTSVVIGNGVTSIDGSAFRDCSNLTSVTIGERVTVINSSAFSGCISLANITIPNSITRIAMGAFMNCSNLTDVYYKGTETEWNDVNISSGNTPLTNNATIYFYSEAKPSSDDNHYWHYVNGVPTEWVRDGEGLEYTLNSDSTAYSITGIGTCEDAAIAIPETYNGLPVTSIGANAFKDCSSLNNITIPASVTIIDDSAFSGCSSLISIVIPDSVTSISGYAFSGCSSLLNVDIGKGVTSIGDYAFNGCSALENVYISDMVAWCNIPFGYNSSNPLYYAKNLYLNGELITELVIPEGVTTISNYAFYECSSLASVIVPDSVTSIGNHAFEACSSLTNVIISKNVTSIGGYAFNGCSNLTDVYHKGTEAEWNNITIYSNNTPLTNNATIYHYSEAKPSSDGNYWHYVNGVPAAWVKGSEGLKYTLNSDSTSYSVTGIGACEDADVIIPKTYNKLPVTNIGSNAFYNCSSLASVVIPDSVTYIGDSAFRYCSSLTSVDIPDSVTEISSSAFSGCSSLTSVDIPDSVTSIGAQAFYGCSKLTSISIPDSVTYIRHSAFYYCSSLTSVVIPDSVTYIDKHAFAGCSSLTSVVIPDSVTFIGDYAFWYCSSLTDVYYTGTETEWNDVNISGANSALTDATIHFESEV